MKKIYNLNLFAALSLVLGVSTNGNAQCTTPPTPVVNNPTICTGSSATITATGSPSLMTGWYTNSFGGNAVGMGTSYTTPTLSASTNYYVAQLQPTGTASLQMPAQSSTFSGSVRGYWFVAPTSFMITGVRVPTDASSGNSNIAILKLPATPPVYSSTTSVFDVLYLTQNDASGTGTISVNIPVYAGDIIGVLGNRADVNSYAAVSPYTASLGTFTTTLTRFGMQFALSSNTPQAVWTETTTSASISRVELYTTLGCLNSLTTASVTVNSCSTGLTELNAASVDVYPNPSHGNLNVTIQSVSNKPTIEIFDAVGKSVFVTEIISTESNFDISYLANGVYMYKISNTQGNVKVGKLVKE